ncbi:aminopeptidase P family N-terminal domain-containing protein [Chloroflexi bacterium TSY]|nr:aminopeptidase P family N-terminal domain-containing protein [Chloroflexi bacterium TSY]
MTTTATRSVHLNQAHYGDRIVQIQHHLAKQELDGLLLLDAANIMWASGFFHIPNERPLSLYIPTNDAPILFVPFLEKENAEASGIETVKTYWEFPGAVPPEVWMMQEIPGEKIAVDGVGHGRFLQMQGVKPQLCLDGVVAKLRYIKTEAELALIQQAAAYADFGLSVARSAVAERIHSGVTELDVV